MGTAVIFRHFPDEAVNIRQRRELWDWLNRQAPRNIGKIHWLAEPNAASRARFRELDELISFGKVKTVVVWRLGCFGMELGRLVSLLTLLEERQGGVVSLVERLDTSTDEGRHIAEVLQALHRAEWTRNRAEKGVRGRPPKLDCDAISQLEMMVKAGKPRGDICRELGIARNTLWKKVRLLGLPVGPRGGFHPKPKTEPPVMAQHRRKHPNLVMPEKGVAGGLTCG